MTLLQKGEHPERPAAEIARRLQKILDEFCPEVVVIPGWSDPAALAALDWALNHNARAVVMSESTAWDEIRRRWKEWVKSRVVRLCSAALVGGTPHAEYARALGMPAECVFQGYDAVDNAHFFDGAQTAREAEPAMRARLALPQKFFLACTRFLPRKNLSLLLRAFATLKERTGAAVWDLVIVGDGPERPQLEREVSALALSGSVRFPGFLQYDELPVYYGLAGAFIHPSISEPWGLVVNEAMAAGLPVLVSKRCGCARDLIDEGRNGYSFDPRDAAGLTRLMERLCTASPEELSAMGDASREIVSRHSADVFAANLERAVAAALERPVRKRAFVDRLLIAALLRHAETTAARLVSGARQTPATAA